jgi:hypothetical protein
MSEVEPSRPYSTQKLAAVVAVDAPNPVASPHGAGLTLVNAGSIQMRRQPWLWPQRIPIGGAVVLAGQEGLGKSLLALDLSARVSIGTLGGDLNGPAGVVYASAEDSEDTVLVPRLRAAGANLDLVHFPRIDGLIGGLSLPRHLPELVAEMRARNAHLLVLDPFSVHLGDSRMDPYKERDVRQALAALATAMAELDAAAIGIMHWNKAPSPVVLDRVLGSRGFTAAARSVLGVGLDPNDPETRLLVVAKSNFAPTSMPALSFNVEERCIDDPEGGPPLVTAALSWTGERTGVRAADLLRTESEEDHGSLAAACALLGDLLLDGPLDSKDVRRGLQAAGISERTASRARRQLGVFTEMVRDGKGRVDKWMIRLP